MPFRIREHTADVAVEASGNSIEEVFAGIANGFVAASCDSIPETGETFELSVQSESREALLFDYLDELIYQRDTRNVLPVGHDVTVHTKDGRWYLDGRARGVPLEDVDAREVKAVTYSEMRLEECEGEWEAYVVFDV